MQSGCWRGSVITKRSSAIALLVAGLAGGVLAYEDLTHQRLTEQACKIAAAHGAGAVSEDKAHGGFRESIIAGAGSHSWGEDYTTYSLTKCPQEVRVRSYEMEPLNHFWSTQLGEGPAFRKIVQFYEDAVKLWKAGKKQEAALILGRAVHLIEDMAQPQHAMDEWHLDRYKLGGVAGPQKSFLEEFSEAQVASGELCPERGTIPSHVYEALIAGIGGGGRMFGPFSAVTEMQAASATAGEEFLNKVFTVSQINAWYPASPISALCGADGYCTHLALPFQFSDHSCGPRVYVPGVDFEGTGTQAGATKRIDLGMKLKEGELQTAAFASEHKQALLAPCVAYAAGLVEYFWNEVKDVKPNPKPCDPPPPSGDGMRRPTSTGC